MGRWTGEGNRRKPLRPGRCRPRAQGVGGLRDDPHSGQRVDPVQVLVIRAFAFGFYVCGSRPRHHVSARSSGENVEADPAQLRDGLLVGVFGNLHNPFAGIGWTIGTFTQPLAAAVSSTWSWHSVRAAPGPEERWLVGISYMIVVPVQLLRDTVLTRRSPSAGQPTPGAPRTCCSSPGTTTWRSCSVVPGISHPCLPCWPASRSSVIGSGPERPAAAHSPRSPSASPSSPLSSGSSGYAVHGTQ